MIRYMMVLLLVFAQLGATVTIASAHSGRTDKNGCHRDRSTGTRHCH